MMHCAFRVHHFEHLLYAGKPFLKETNKFMNSIQVSIKCNNKRHKIRFFTRWHERKRDREGGGGGEEGVITHK